MHTHGRIQVYGLGDLLDTSIRLYRGAFLAFVLTAAVAMVPLALLGLAELAIGSALGGDTDTADDVQSVQQFSPLLAQVGSAVGAGRRAGWLEQLASLVVTPVMEGALIYGAARRMFGAGFTMRSGYSSAFQRAWPLIGAQLLVALLVAIALVPIACVAISVFQLLLAPGVDDVLSGGSGGGVMSLVAAVGVTLLLIMPLLLFLLTRFVLTSQAAMLERNGPWESVKRSWQLTAGSFWRVLGYVVVIGLLSSVLSLIIPLTLSFPLRLLFPERSWLLSTVDAVAGAVSGVLVTPFSVIAYTVLYYDLRVRSEGIEGLSFDLGSALLGPVEAPGAEQ